jgi:hypothetical protein
MSPLPWLAIESAAFAPAVMGATVLTITNLPSADTTLFQYSPDGNLGLAPTLVVGTTANGARGRALLRFPMPIYPAGARVESAEVEFEVVKAPQMRPPEPSVFALSRVLVGWLEGGGRDSLGAPARVGEATWHSRVHGSVQWAVPGGAFGIDYAPQTSSTTDGPVLREGKYRFPSTPQTVAEVQEWLEFPERNHGWLIHSLAEESPATARRLGSREEPFVAPRLILRLGLPPEPPLLRIRPTAAGVELNFRAVEGVAYRVESWSADLGSPSSWLLWTNLPPFIVPTDVRLVDFPDFAALPARYYRVLGD